MHWQDEEAVTLPNAIPIRRCSGITPEATMREHLCGEGFPVVVTDAQQDWQARKLWSFDYFARHFGDETLLVNDRAPFRPDDDPPNQTLRISMREYVRYLTEAEPHGHSLAARERGFPFYGNSWAPFNAEPELAGHISRPAFVPDSMPEEPEGARRLSNDFTKVLGPGLGLANPYQPSP